ncbi:MAG: thermonuclease family protein [Microcystis sp. M54BS1]|nr:thermonuclease family protein [Microcystis sp. M54BS1]MCA6440988.1 thermonuclease family protein [Chitinophagaceae bacterium]MCA6455525.1 thermonuclease family protein [Chitinophagaceae bacterium]
MSFTKRLYKIFLFFLFVSCSSEVKEIDRQITGEVIAVKDGDTIEILFDGKPLTVRFAHVDCPEIKKGQPFGKAAKKFTSDLCFGQTVTIINEGKYDRYKRLIAVVINEKNENVNKELVKAGLAWHFKKYSTDTSYDDLELTARQNKIGLWVDNNPTPPWDWRKR